MLRHHQTSNINHCFLHDVLFLILARLREAVPLDLFKVVLYWWYTDPFVYLPHPHLLPAAQPPVVHSCKLSFFSSYSIDPCCSDFHYYPLLVDTQDAEAATKGGFAAATPAR